MIWVHHVEVFVWNLKKIGFKQNYEYKVEDLPGAVSAYFGFMKNDLGEPEDYEIRFCHDFYSEVSTNIGSHLLDSLNFRTCFAVKF